MARTEQTDRQLLNEFSSFWLPKKVPKSPDTRDEITEDIYEMIQKDKGYASLIDKLRKMHNKKEIEDDIQQCIIERQLLQASKWDEDKWKEIDKKDVELQKYYDELAAIGPTED